MQLPSLQKVVEHWSSLSDVICSQKAEGGHRCAWPTTMLTIAEGEILVQCRVGYAKDIQQAALFRAAPQWVQSIWQPSFSIVRL